jgi:NADH dehydrogenase
MKVLVAGGTGLLGREITRSLLERGHEVVVMSRKRPAGDEADGRAAWVAGDVTDPASLAGPLEGADAVVDAVQFPNSPIENPKKGYTFERIDLGGTKNLADAAKAAGVRQFIGISGAGAAEGGKFHWLRCKWQEEQHIRGTGLPYTIFRPSWIYGPRDVSLNRFLGFARFLPFVPVIGNGKTRITPLFVGDLGAHAAAAVGNEAVVNRAFEIGGPEELTMDDVVRTALKVAGKRRFLLHQPAGLMKFGASILQHVPGRPLTPDAVDFITMDGVVDTRDLRDAFGLPLTRLEDGLRTYLPR